MGARTRLFVLLGMTLSLVLFQNCSKASFNGASSQASLDPAASGSLTPVNPPNPPPNNPPGGSTVCADFGGSCDPTHAFVGELFVEPRNTLVPRDHGGATVMAGPKVSLAALMQSSWLQGGVVNGTFQPYHLVSSSFDLDGSFANTFHAQDGTSIEVPDANGGNQAVSAWFALSMSAGFHLDANDAPGADYQFAVISDDGAQILYQPAGATSYQMLVDNETPENVGDGFYLPGTQYGRMGCSATLNDVTKIVVLRALTKAQVIPLQLNYFNGPAGLTLHLVYRQVPAAGAVDVMCETDSNAGAHKSPVVKASPILDYSQLAARGWKVVGPLNLN